MVWSSINTGGVILTPHFLLCSYCDDKGPNFNHYFLVSTYPPSFAQPVFVNGCFTPKAIWRDLKKAPPSSALVHEGITSLSRSFGASSRKIGR